jgi:hypothetical protein
MVVSRLSEHFWSLCPSYEVSEPVKEQGMMVLRGLWVVVPRPTSQLSGGSVPSI